MSKKSLQVGSYINNKCVHNSPCGICEAYRGPACWASVSAGAWRPPSGVCAVHPGRAGGAVGPPGGESLPRRLRGHHAPPGSCARSSPPESVADFSTIKGLALMLC